MLNYCIDFIQDNKKNFVNLFVQSEEVKKILVDFVDAQTAYTKAAVENGMQTTGKINSLIMKILL